MTFPPSVTEGGCKESTPTPGPPPGEELRWPPIISWERMSRNGERSVFSNPRDHNVEVLFGFARETLGTGDCVWKGVPVSVINPRAPVELWQLARHPLIWGGSLVRFNTADIPVWTHPTPPPTFSWYSVLVTKPQNHGVLTYMFTRETGTASSATFVAKTFVRR